MLVDPKWKPIIAELDVLGFVIVPKEPSSEQINVAGEVTQISEDERAEIYRAMISPFLQEIAF